MNISEAEKTYNVKHRLLITRIKQARSRADKVIKFPSKPVTPVRTSPKQRRQILPAAGVTLVKDTLKEISKMEFSMTQASLLDLCMSMADEIVNKMFQGKDPLATIFGRPTKTWARKLINSEPLLKQMLRQTRKCSARSSSHWCTALGTLLVSLGLLGDIHIDQRVWVAEEIGFTRKVNVDPSMATHTFESYCDGENGCISLLCCGSASGCIMQPFIVLPGKLMESDIIANGPAGATYSLSDSGWMDKDQIYEWFQEFIYFLGTHEITGPIVLLLSDRFRYFSIDLVQMALKNNISLFALPPDVHSPFSNGILKMASNLWKSKLIECCEANRIMSICNILAVALIKELVLTFMAGDSLREAFSEVGLLPFNPALIKDPSLVVHPENETITTLMEGTASQTRAVASDSTRLAQQDECMLFSLEDMTLLDTCFNATEEIEVTVDSRPFIVEAMPPVPADPEATPPVPADPEATPPVPADPEVTPPVPADPEATPPVPADPEATPPVPADPEVTPPVPADPEATPPVPADPEVTPPVPADPEAKSMDTPPVVAKSMDTPPVVAKSMDTPPVVAKSMDTPPVVAKSMDTPPVVAKSMDTPPVVAKSTDTSPVVAKSMDTPPVVAKSMDTPPVVAKSMDTSPVVAKSMDTSPVVAKSMDTSPVVAKSMDTSPVVAKSMDTSPVVAFCKTPDGRHGFDDVAELMAILEN